MPTQRLGAPLSEVTGCSNLWRPKTLTLARTNRRHCPLGAHLSRHIRDAAGLRVGIGPVASRLALSWPDLLGLWLGLIKEATSHCLLCSSGSGAVVRHQKDSTRTALEPAN